MNRETRVDAWRSRRGTRLRVAASIAEQRIPFTRFFSPFFSLLFVYFSPAFSPLPFSDEGQPGEEEEEEEEEKCEKIAVFSS